ncbi:MAG: TlpA family protein disulfide reductase [Haliscomenobacter sp.]|nr:TlpA family protein disulfide reductase [Haliscomenobacter sp.]MBK7474937.1 TlpA family protein disulfide reductase [Haliscomenobacter sp.]
MKISFPTFALVIGLALGGIVAGRYFYFQPQFIQGEKTPEVEAVLMDGSPFRLSSLKGKYVLLDFWGSWCGPCRAQNAELRELYIRFENRAFSDASGFEIVSVAVERKPENWKAAIEQDGLIWKNHILDQSKSLKFFTGPLAQAYKVRQLPTSFLLNPKGAIIRVNPDPAEIDDLLRKKENVK